MSKCALIAFKWNNPERTHAEVFADKDKWNINGINIPTPETYVYLGIEFNLALFHSTDKALQIMVHTQVQKGRQAVHALRPFLCCATIPKAIKVAVVRSVILSKMLWGSELWGMSERRVEQVQRAINVAMRFILRVRGPASFVAISCMQRELGITYNHTVQPYTLTIQSNLFL